MLAQVFSCASLGVDAYLVRVEVDIGGGLPSFSTVGLPDGAVKESKDRVGAAIKNAGFMFPRRRITVNLAPADIRKEGAAFDLPMAVGILAATRQVRREKLMGMMMLGELSLDGSLRTVRGVLSMAMEARRHQVEGLIVPAGNAREAACVEGVRVFPVSSLMETVELLNGDRHPQPFTVDLKALFSQSSSCEVDFSDVKGQEHVKRALEVAAAGGHNIIMIGPPGSGKTMLARRFPTILPPLTLEEALETTRIHSVAGLLPKNTALVGVRPFRAPHHTISDAGLIGGGHHPRPGEVSLAHHGVLFLDELPEFKKNVLEVMRQPLEDGHVTIARASVSLTYPANFMLAAAMNPCPCGYYSDSRVECTCTPVQIQRYMSRISGPLLDRIDIHIEVPAVRYKELSGRVGGDSSADIRTRVVLAREMQLQRFQHRKIYSNAQMASQDIRRYCAIDEDSSKLLQMAVAKFGLSARAYDRILKVSRTIADLGGREDIGPAHIAEAIQYRSLDRNLWM
jgi:magnesium chelatase family protein